MRFDDGGDDMAAEDDAGFVDEFGEIARCGEGSALCERG